MEKQVIVKRLKDGQEMVIPKKHLEDTLKQGFEFIADYSMFVSEDVIEEVTLYECPLCAFVGKSERGLKRHKTVSHK